MKKLNNEVSRLTRRGLLKTMAVFAFVQLLCAFIIPPVALAQTPGVTFSSERATVKQVLDAIKQQTNLSTVFDVQDVDLQRTVSINVRNASVNAVLEKLFSGTDVTYVVNATHIVLTTTPAPQVNNAQRALVTIKGKVTDAAGQPLVGVSVAVVGTSKGVSTGFDGTYSIQTEPGKTLSFSYLGYADRKITVPTSSTDIDVVLQEIATVVEGVVVTALGIKREEKSLSYNVQQVGSDKFTTVKDANFVNSLNGKVAGVQINAGAGGPGAGSKVVLRGAKSLSKGNNALYVIDGVPMFEINLGGGTGVMGVQSGTSSIADLNPDDIESMNVLTGPSAAALYGNDAANGVIIINTKKGFADKTTVTITNNTTFSSALMMPRMQNTYANNVGEFDSWGDKTDLRYNPESFFNTGINVNNSISLSTGREKSQTYLSVATNNATGILPNNTYDRYNFSFRNTTTFFQDKMNLDVNGSYIIQDDNNIVAQGQYFNPLPALYMFPRGDDFSEIQMYERYEEVNGIFLQYWPYGNQGLSLQNPYWIMNRMNRENSKNRYMFGASLQYKIFDWLDVVGRVKLDNTHMDETQKFYASTDPNFASKFGRYSMNKRDYRQFYGDILVNINKNFGDFNVNANIGGSIKDLRMDLLGQQGDLWKKYNLFTIQNLSPVNYKPRQDGYTEEVQSAFVNAEVSYKGMLYLTATARNDWDSHLAFSNYNSFFYPSVGLSAIVTEMVELPEFISFLKVRGSFSSVGSSYSRYLTNPFFEYDDVAHTWATSRAWANPNLKPEMTNSYEMGLDLRLFKNVIRLNASYYRSNTYNQTFQATLSPSSGFNSVYVQSGDIQNEGVELTLGLNKAWGDFRWASDYTFTTNKNKINRLADGVINPVTGEPIEMPELRRNVLGSQGSPQIILKKGGSIGDIYYSRELKKDANGQIWVDSKTYKVEVVTIPETKAGSLLPKYTMGWSNGFSWKDIDLNVLVTARVGGLVVSNTEAMLDYYGVSQTTADARDNGGVPLNNGTVDPKMYYQTIGAGTGVGPYYIYSATNVRLQELSLGYNMPRKWFNDKCAVNVSLIGRNLFMIYNKAPFDPELAPSSTDTYYQGVDYFMHPSLRNIGFSVKLQF